MSRARQQTSALLHECDAWLDRLSTKYALPRAVLVKMLRPTGALEREIGIWIAERATYRAEQLFEADDPAPDGNDLWARAVRGVHSKLVAERDAAEDAERRARWAETDDLIRRMKAGEDVL